MQSLCCKAPLSVEESEVSYYVCSQCARSCDKVIPIQHKDCDHGEF